MRSNVYLIRSGKKGPIKIGIAKNVDSRISELQIGNPNKLFLVAIFPIHSEKKAREIERHLHKLFKRQHIRGEWFRSDISFSRIEKSEKMQALFNTTDNPDLRQGVEG